MVKANGYGHGDIECALRLQAEGAQSLGVGLIEEGILLRQAGVHCDILFYGIFDRGGAEAVLKYRLTPVISLLQQLKDLEEVSESVVDVHLKFDTGMHRLGFSRQQASDVFEFLKKSKRIRVRGLMTHLHSAEDLALGEKSSAFGQLQDFEVLIKSYENLFGLNDVHIHSLNSAALLGLGPDLKKKLKYQHGGRPGLSLYGIAPIDTELKLQPVMSLKSHLVRVFQVPKGATVSYGARWKASRPSWIGVVPLGYADGYPRLLSNKASILFRGQRVPQVGSVCMDYLMLDLTESIEAKGEVHFNGEDDEVILFGQDESGQEITVSELATHIGTIPWEILTGISERVHRVIEGKSFNHMKQQTFEVRL
jgi:alanine racemase